MSNSKVFLPQIVHRYDASKQTLVPAFDFSAATRFGALVEILQPEDDITFVNRYMPKISASLEDFTEDDFFLAVGDPAVIAACAGVIFRQQSSMKVLKWDRKLRDYFISEIKL
jgi:hypothetical protein